MPKPGPEHAKLKAVAGTWDVECTYFMAPDQPPMQTKARETVTMLGEFWSIGRFESNMMGMPFIGVATVGYDPARGKWVASWVDTFTPNFFAFEGDYDAAGRVLEMSGPGGDMMGGGMINYRTTEEMLDADTRKFEMFRETPGGGWAKIFSYVYRRAKSAPKPAKASSSGTSRSAKPKAKAKAKTKSAPKRPAAKSKAKSAKAAKRRKGGKAIKKR
jgi:hypothetical protein